METVSTFFDFNNYLATINFAENKKNLITVNDFLLSTNENNDIIANIVPNNTTFSLVRNKFSKHENCIIICSKGMSLRNDLGTDMKINWTCVEIHGNKYRPRTRRLKKS